MRRGEGLGPQALLPVAGLIIPILRPCRPYRDGHKNTRKTAGFPIDISPAAWHNDLGTGSNGRKTGAGQGGPEVEATMSPSIRDVAKLAGVGKGTVSRVLNDSPGVSEKTAARVRQAIR